jgi:hypothetical protein
MIVSEFLSIRWGAWGSQYGDMLCNFNARMSQMLFFDVAWYAFPVFPELNLLLAFVATNIRNSVGMFCLCFSLSKVGLISWKVTLSKKSDIPDLLIIDNALLVKIDIVKAYDSVQISFFLSYEVCYRG